MEKGKFGVRLAFYAVAAFVFAMLGWYLALVLLAGVVIVGEQNEWAGRQVIEAFVLLLAAEIINSVLGLFSIVGYIPIIGSIWYKVIGVFGDLLRIAVYVFSIIAIVKVAKGKEAGVPLADKFADWVYGKVVPKPVAPAAPVAPAQPATPAQPVAPAQPATPVAPAAVCTNCGTPLNGGAFCAKCGTPAAK